jgi:hypothetical protein
MQNISPNTRQGKTLRQRKKHAFKREEVFSAVTSRYASVGGEKHAFSRGEVFPRRHVGFARAAGR